MVHTFYKPVFPECKEEPGFSPPGKDLFPVDRRSSSRSEKIFDPRRKINLSTYKYTTVTAELFRRVCFYCGIDIG